MKNKTFYFLLAVLIAVSILFWINMFQGPASSEELTSEFQTGDISLTMYHGEGCACCVRWADYLRDHGVEVKEELLEDPHEIKNERSVPIQLRSCHTAIVGDYVVEGHVPIEDIQRLLAEQPDAIGISAPGMPPNAPGMDAPISREYQIILFDKERNMTVYATHN